MNWRVTENIAWCVAFLLCVMFLEGNWKWMSVFPLMFVTWMEHK